jgi:hypothetical protein
MHHLHPHLDQSPDRSGFSRGRLLSVLLVAQLMVILDISAVNVALPDLARDLQIGPLTSPGRSPATRCCSAACFFSAAVPPTCSADGVSSSRG